jgi:hypothetical protein
VKFILLLHAGTIGYYGVASNALGATMAHGQAVSLDRLLRVARDAGGEFLCIAMVKLKKIAVPANLF